MSLSAHEIAALAGGRLLAGPPEALVAGVAALEDAGSSDASFFAGDPRYRPALDATRAGVVLVPDDFAGSAPPNTALVGCANPSYAFVTVVARLQPPLPAPGPGVHPTAVVAPGARLGKNVCVQAYAVVEDGAEIGDDVIVGAHGYVGPGCRVGAGTRLHPRVTLVERVHTGENCVIHSGAVLGADGFGFETVDGVHRKVPQVGGVELGDDVEVGANCTIDRARFGMTRVGAGTKLDNLVHLAHNVVVGPHCLLAAQTGISGSTRLGKYVSFGGQVGLVGHITVGDGASVGAQGGVTKSIPAGEMWWGTPAAPLREIKDQIARVRRLGRLAERIGALEVDAKAARGGR